jgi:hypothetical protein
MQMPMLSRLLTIGGFHVNSDDSVAFAALLFTGTEPCEMSHHVSQEV